MSVHIIHWHCFQVSYARANLEKRNRFASRRTLDYFRKKHPEYANNWLVTQIAVRAEMVNVTAYRVGYDVILNYVTRVITSQKLLQRVAVML